MSATLLSADRDFRIEKNRLLDNLRSGAESLLCQTEMMPFVSITPSRLLAAERSLHALQELLAELTAYT